MHGYYNFALSAMVASAAMSSVDAGDLSAGDVVQIEMNSDMPVLDQDLLRVNDGISDDDDEDLAGRKLGKSSKSSSKDKTNRAGDGDNSSSKKKGKSSKSSSSKDKTNRAADGDNSSSKKKKEKKKKKMNRNDSGKKKKKKNQTTEKTQTEPKPVIVDRADIVSKKKKKKNQATEKTQTEPKPVIVDQADNGAVEEEDIIEKAGGGAIVTAGDSYNFVQASTSAIPILNSRDSYNFVPAPTASPLVAEESWDFVPQATSTPTVSPSKMPTASPTASPSKNPTMPELAPTASARDSYNFVPAPPTSPLVAVESWDFIPRATSTPTVSPSKMPTASPTSSPSKIPTMNTVSKADVTTGTGTDALDSKYQCFYEQGIKICFAYHEDQKCEMSIENYDCSCCLYTDPNHPVINSFDCTNIGPEWGALGVCASPDMRADNLDYPSEDGI